MRHLHFGNHLSTFVVIFIALPTSIEPLVLRIHRLLLLRGRLLVMLLRLLLVLLLLMRLRRRLLLMLRRVSRSLHMLSSLLWRRILRMLHWYLPWSWARIGRCGRHHLLLRRWALSRRTSRSGMNLSRLRCLRRLHTDSTLFLFLFLPKTLEVLSASLVGNYTSFHAARTSKMVFLFF